MSLLQMSFSGAVMIAVIAALLASAALLIGIVAFFATQPTAAAENDAEPTAAAITPPLKTASNRKPCLSI